MNVTVGVHANPDVSPCGRDRDRLDARQFIAIFDDDASGDPDIRTLCRNDGE